MLINPYVFGRLWTPAQLTTALWLDAADSSTITQSSGLISQVNDKSGNGRNFTASGSARPTYSSGTLNGLPVFTFGGSQYLTSTSSASVWNFLHQSGGSEVVGVVKFGNSSDPNALYGYWGTNALTGANQGIADAYDDRTSGSRNDVLLILAASSSAAYIDVTGNGSCAANVANIIGASFNLGTSTASNKIRHVVNATVLTGNNTDSSSPSTATATYTLQIGATGNNVSPLTGYIAEFIVTSSQLSTSNRQLVEGYLAWKWGLTGSLPAGHPYKSAAPTI